MILKPGDKIRLSTKRYNDCKNAYKLNDPNEVFTVLSLWEKGPRHTIGDHGASVDETGSLYENVIKVIKPTIII